MAGNENYIFWEIALFLHQDHIEHFCVRYRYYCHGISSSSYQNHLYPVIRKNWLIIPKMHRKCLPMTHIMPGRHYLVALPFALIINCIQHRIEA